MAKPLICYDSLAHLDASVITANGTEAGFDVADIADYKAFTLWKFNSTTPPARIDIDTVSGADADYIALINHNLNTLSATVEVFADSFTPPTTSRLGAVTPDEDTVTLKTFTAPGSLRYWRIEIEHASSFPSKPFVGDILIGLKTELPEFMAPSFDPYFDGAEVSGARSSAGHYLGGVIRGETHRGRITFGQAGAAKSDFTSTLDPLWRNHLRHRRPFVFVLDTADTEFDTARYVKMTDDGQPERQAVGGSWQRMTWSIPVEEAFMEPIT